MELNYLVCGTGLKTTIYKIPVTHADRAQNLLTGRGDPFRIFSQLGAAKKAAFQIIEADQSAGPAKGRKFSFRPQEGTAEHLKAMLLGARESELETFFIE